jgi:ribosomal protein S3
MNRIKRYLEKRKLHKQIHSITPKKVRRLINQFFVNEDIVRQSLEITDVVVKNKWYCVKVTITLGRPGLLIGKAGKTIDALVLYLEKILEKNVVISIKESKLWW